jgi:hypothetical protein
VTDARCGHLDFLIIGAMKAGTSSMFDFLAAHPGVDAPRNKEPHYFSRSYRMPVTYYRWVFRGRIEGQITGEASPTYSRVQRYPEVPRRIAADAPGIPLIFMIRDPVERLLSHYRHRLLLGRQSGDAAKEIAPALWERSGPQSRRTLSTSTPDSCSWSTWTMCSRAANHSCGSSTISACRDERTRRAARVKRQQRTILDAVADRISRSDIRWGVPPRHCPSGSAPVGEGNARTNHARAARHPPRFGGAAASLPRTLCGSRRAIRVGPAKVHRRAGHRSATIRSRFARVLEVAAQPS